MSGIKDVVKGGWHPKGKDGGEESWRNDNKGINTVVCSSTLPGIVQEANIVSGRMDGERQRSSEIRRSS
jgi:hypothetical protein